jgi:hypothetical protein
MISTTILAMSIATSGLASSTEPDEIQRHYQARIVEWQKQIDSAQKDEALVKSVDADFTRTTIAPPINAVDADKTLSPLRRLFPDYRLRYRGPADHCSVGRAIETARQDALRRKVEALKEQRAVYGELNLYNRMKLNVAIAEITGATFGQADVAKAAKVHLDESPLTAPEQIDSGFSELSWLDEGLADACR